MSYQRHLKLLENENFSLKIDQSPRNFDGFLFNSLIATNKQHRNDLKKYPKENLKKIIQENS